MRVIKLSADKQKEMELICERLSSGDVVVMPTETVYGLAADATNEEAVRKIFAIKGRPQDNPLIVHISNFEMLTNLVKKIPSKAKKLAGVFWPGPLTLVLEDSGLVSEAVTCGQSTVAARMPKHPVALEIINFFGRPLAAPSANISGAPSPTDISHCISDLGDKVELFVDGGRCKVGLESTVIHVPVEGLPVILRPGIINKKEIEAVVGEIAENNQEKEALQVQISSPGTRYKHYSPKTKAIAILGSKKAFVEYVNGKIGLNYCAMVFDGEKKMINGDAYEYGAEDQSASLAYNFFAILRECDSKDYDVIYIQAPHKTTENAALYDRLMRATGYVVVTLE